MESLQLKAVILDWAGTLVDFGSRAPLQAFIQVFSDARISVNEAQTRIPMGTEKKEHIRRMLQQEAIQAAWQEEYGRSSQESDIDDLYRQLTPIQIQEIDKHSQIVPGADKLFVRLRERNLRIGSTTGYSRMMIEGMLANAQQQGLRPDCVVAADEAVGARPGPAAALKNVIEMEIPSVSLCVKVDDTAAGIHEGRNAGMWTVAVVLSGNASGLSQESWQMLSEEEKNSHRTSAYQKLENSGAHYLIDDISKLEPVLVDINRRLALGQRP
ncbi:phosphonoacetaldehyde hydrolase [Microbulbifer echini]|uniref:Phosphonoacetaldehyde hydrolase n=1 Tax=Microbulbifer echini TaxID=1529067 RepID=A0ABV4NSI6_9GAMM|nr:phosphonoacetaldehyde hydrolase [uncultured Microbulbifer sp.]